MDTILANRLILLRALQKHKFPSAKVFVPPPAPPPTPPWPRLINIPGDVGSEVCTLNTVAAEMTSVLLAKASFKLSYLKLN